MNGKAGRGFKKWQICLDFISDESLYPGLSLKHLIRAEA